MRNFMLGHWHPLSSYVCRGNMYHIRCHFFILTIEPPEGHVPSYIRRWEEDLQISFTTMQTERIISLAHKSSIASRFQEQGYKLLVRWYMFPALLNKLYLQASNICWQCKKEPGTLFHIFWACPLIISFWKEVGNWIKQLTSVDLGSDPLGYLLHLNAIPLINIKSHW